MKIEKMQMMLKRLPNEGLIKMTDRESFMKSTLPKELINCEDA